MKIELPDNIGQAILSLFPDTTREIEDSTEPAVAEPPQTLQRSSFDQWTCMFPGKGGVSWKRAWDGVGTKSEADEIADENCNVVTVPLELWQRYIEYETRMVAAEEKLVAAPPHETPKGTRRWGFKYRNRTNGPVKNGRVWAESRNQVDAKIAAIYGNILDWDVGCWDIEELRDEPAAPPQSEPQSAPSATALTVEESLRRAHDFIAGEWRHAADDARSMTAGQMEAEINAVIRGVNDERELDKKSASSAPQATLGPDDAGWYYGVVGDREMMLYYDGRHWSHSPNGHPLKYNPLRSKRMVPATELAAMQQRAESWQRLVERMACKVGNELGGDPLAACEKLVSRAEAAERRVKELERANLSWAEGEHHDRRLAAEARIAELEAKLDNQRLKNSRDCLAILDGAGMGQNGKANCLIDMVREVVSELTAANQAAAARRDKSYRYLCARCQSEQPVLRTKRKQKTAKGESVWMHCGEYCRATDLRESDILDSQEPGYAGRDYLSPEAVAEKVREATAELRAMIDNFLRDALVAIAGAVCTPERGYHNDGGLGSQIASEKIGGNEFKEACEKTALAEIAGIEAWIAGGCRQLRESH